MRLALLVVTSLTLLAAGCDKKDTDLAPASSAAAATTAATSATSAASSTATPAAKAVTDADGCQVKVNGKVEVELYKEKVGYTITNATKKAVTFCQVSMYAYDKDDKQITGSDVSVSYMTPLEPGVTKDELIYVEDPKTPKSLAKAPGVSFEVVVSHVKFADGTQWEDSTVAPPARPKGGKR